MNGQNISCPRCGNQLAADAKFCGSCGATMQVAIPQGQTGEPTSSSVGKVVTAAKGVLNKFSNEEQDPSVVADVYSKVSTILTYSEEILYIAVQKKLIPNVSPDCVVLTNKRFIKYTKKNVGIMGVKVPLTCRLGGADFEDYNWRDLHDAHVKEGIRSATLTLKTTQGQIISVDDLPKAQARQLYALARSIQDRSFEERRQRELEDKRAAVGSVNVQTGILATSQPVSQPAQEDPMEKLAKLKKMVEAGMITEDEYNTKKAEILSKM